MVNIYTTLTLVSNILAIFCICLVPVVFVVFTYVIVALIKEGKSYGQDRCNCNGCVGIHGYRHGHYKGSEHNKGY